ncbi:MAG: AAA family ATPase [Lachnospiraceae bacterium]|nr:AAA family ATPase [Lachnospiraceae bacterium]
MKLISCHVENFGKLSDVTIDFKEGLNLFHEPNAWGKSTLAAFLRIMFYGFDSKKESGSFDKERVVYRPWQGGTYGGELDFSFQGRDYRISRTFGKTEKTDTFHLYDLHTKLECHDFSSDIGIEIFGLDSASFKRSAFIAQNDCECGSTDAINAKLGNLVENTNDINNFETAQKRIHDRMNKLSPDRATGSIRKRKNTITLLQEELRSYDAAESAAREISDKFSEKQKQKAELMEIRGQYAKALQLASEESRRESLKNTYESLCQEEEQKRKKLSLYQHMFPGRVPRDQEFVEKNQQIQMLGVLKTTIHNLGLTEEEKTQYHKLSDMFDLQKPSEKEMEDIGKELDRLEKLKEEKSQLETKISYFEAMAMQNEDEETHAPSRKPLMLAGILVLLAGLVACGVFRLTSLLPAAIVFPAMLAASAVAVLGIVLFGLGKYLAVRDEKLQRQQEEKRIEEEKRLHEPVEEIQKTMDEAAKEISRIETRVTAFFGRYHVVCDISSARTKLYELKGQMQDYERLKARESRSQAAQEEYDRTQETLVSFGKETEMVLGDDIAGGIGRMQLKAAEYRMAQKDYDIVLEKKKQFERENDIAQFEIKNQCPYPLDELNRMIQDVDERIEEVREAIEQYRHQLEDLEEQLDARDEKQQQLLLCRQEQEEETEKYEILGITQDFLQNAKEQFSARYLGPIENGFGKYYEMLTGEKEKSYMVNANIDVQIKEQGEMRESKWLSAGYQDLLGVCMRLALVDAMYPGEKPFLILDDPFVNLDEDKIVHGRDLLNRISEEYQILYFTCHHSRCLQ